MSSSFPLLAPWQNYYTQIENATRLFWQQATYLNHGRIQGPEVWERLQKKAQELLAMLFPSAPLTQFETFLLSVATLLYECGWQAPGGAEALVAGRYQLSGQLIRQSYLRQEGVPNFGLSNLDSATAETLACICEAMGQDGLAHLSKAPVPAGYQETVRPCYLAAVLQLADAMLVPRQKAAYFRLFRPLTRFREADEARLALHPYLDLFVLAPGSLTLSIRLNPEDRDYAQRITDQIEEPIRHWWAANWHWLASELQVEIMLHLPQVKIIEHGIPPAPLSETCSALLPYLAAYQPPMLHLPTLEQMRKACEEGARLLATTRQTIPGSIPGQGETPVMPEPAEQFDDFHLHIDSHGHIIARSNQGEATDTCGITIPATIDLAIALIEQNQRDANLYRALGRQLYEHLFPSKIHTLFQQTEAVARNNRRNTRIRLDIEAGTLARLPLEFLYREDRGHFLAIDPRTALSRYLHVTYPRNRVRLTQGPLHMLLIISSPSDQVYLDVGEWRDIVTQALEEPISQRLLTLECVTAGTYEEINGAMLRRKPDIIQFVGHGIYQNGTGFLALMKEDGSTWLIDGERFADMFLGSLDSLGLFCLASCESATSDNPQGFLGVTPQLLQRGVPAVIAMQYSVRVKTAKLFFSQLYQSVAYHKPIDWAVQQARNAISAQQGRDNREFATPVLYMRADDGNIF